jgi:signal peptidase I
MRIRVVGFSVLGAAVLVAAGLTLFVFDFPRMATNDMAPTLRARDLLLACRMCGQPERGDVVLFADEVEHSRLATLRVVGVPGDTVELRKGKLLVNGRPLTQEKAPNQQLAIDPVDQTARDFEVAWETQGKHRYEVLKDARTPLAGDKPMQKLTDEYFLIADRRTFARDSRDFGPVSRKEIRSIVLRVLTAGDGDAARQTKLP